MRRNDPAFGGTAPIQNIWIRGVLVQPGSPVRLRPSGHSDILDTALRGKSAVVESLEVDAEGKIYVAVVVDGDPARDFGLLRKVGHRFFYRADEVEPLPLSGETGP